MSVLDLYRELHHEKIQQAFPPSSRVLIETMIGEFNSARWIDELVFSERDLVQLTGLKKTTLHEAKHYLTSRGYIKCKPFKNKTRYSLGDKLKDWLNQPTANRPLSDRQATAFENSNIRVREDLKTSDIPQATATRAHVSAFDWNDETEERLTARWLRNKGVKVSIELLSYLRFLVEKHGFGWTDAIIIEAGDSCEYDKLTPKWLKICVANKLEGGDKRARVAGKSRNARPDIPAFAGGRTGDNFGNTSTSGEGRFDNDPRYADCG